MVTKKETKTIKRESEVPKQGLLAIVRVRGRRNLKPEIVQTLRFLRLNRTNHCSLYRATPQILGMLQKVKDYVAYGPVNEETVFALLKKRGESGSKMLIEKKSVEELKTIAKEIVTGSKKLKHITDPVFRLHPPRRGYKNIKAPFPRGDLGRRTDMDALLKRMM